MNAADFEFGVRRHSDPPNLWLLVLAGSLAMHLLLLLTGRWFSVRVSDSQPVRSATPVEIVGAVPQAPSISAPATQTPKTATTTNPAQVQPTEANQPTLIRKAAQPQSPSQSVRERRSSSPQSVPVPQPTFRSPEAPAIPKSDRSTSTAASPEESSPTPAPTSTPVAPSEPIAPDPTSSETPSPSTTGIALPEPPGGRVPGIPTVGQEEGQESGSQLGSAPGAPMQSEREGVEATVSNAQLGNGGRTVPDTPAVPKASTQSFRRLVYAPEVELNLGQTVRLRVLVTREGKADPQEITVLQPSRSVQYDEFVTDLIKQWEFEPARQAGQPVDSLLDISVQLNSLR